MDDEQLVEHVKRAEHQLEAAAARLRAACAASVLAGEYDAQAFEDLVGQYRRAKRQLLEAQRARDRWQRLQAHRAPPPAAHAPPAEPTPALRFARWLYEHGRIGK
jgi:hypothetical protein